MPSKATISVGEKFLYDFKVGSAGGLRPPSGRQRHDGPRDTGLTLSQVRLSGVTLVTRSLACAIQLSVSSQHRLETQDSFI